MERLTSKILEHVAGLPEGVPVSAKDLLHLGSRVAVGKTLSRLAQRKQLLRADRGLYVRLIETRFGKRLPSVEHLVQFLTDSKSEVIASHGAAAANALGLTTQVPMRAVYLTSGRSRRLMVGEQIIELRHVPRWQLTMAFRPAGEVIRALAWLGEKRAEEALRTLWRRLPPATLKELAASRSRLPIWLAEMISRLVEI